MSPLRWDALAQHHQWEGTISCSSGHTPHLGPTPSTLIRSLLTLGASTTPIFGTVFPKSPCANVKMCWCSWTWGDGVLSVHLPGNVQHLLPTIFPNQDSKAGPVLWDGRILSAQFSRTRLIPGGCARWRCVWDAGGRLCDPAGGGQVLWMLPLLGLLPPIQPHPHHLVLGPALLHSAPGAHRHYH